MFVLSLRKAKILDYNIVPAINLAFPLFKTINLGLTGIVFLQKSLQLNPSRRRKIKFPAWEVLRKSALFPFKNPTTG